MNDRIIVFLCFVVLLIACDLETGDPYDPIFVHIESTLHTDGSLYVSHTTPVTTNTFTRLASPGWWITYSAYDVGVRYSDQIMLFDSFTIRMYSSEVTNALNWDKWNQTDLLLEDCKLYLFYSNTIIDGLTNPILFESGNLLPYYISTNMRLTIHVKELQTNVVH